jgi:DnaJ-class molecular chaperone
MPDPYKTLGLTRDASPEEVRTAYKKLARESHPDKNLDDADAAKARFQAISSAYEELVAREDGGAFSPFGEHAWSGVFASAARCRQYVTVRVGLKTVMEGGVVTAGARVRAPCQQCRGQVTATVECGACGGRGTVQVQVFGMAVEASCGACRGMGSTERTACTRCSGTQAVDVEHTFTAHVMAGWDPVYPVETDSPEVMVRLAHDLPSNVSVQGRDVVVEEFVSIRDVLAGFSRSIALYEGRCIKIRCVGPLDPERPYVSKTKGMPGGRVVVRWNVIWDMRPLQEARHALREALGQTRGRDPHP